MKIAFVRPETYSEWGGDLKAILDLQEGLHLLGHESFIVHNPIAALAADEIFFLSSLVNRSSDFYSMQLLRRRYGCIPFHEDSLLYSGASFGFVYYLSRCLSQKTEEGVSFSLERLYEQPHLIFYYDKMRPIHALQNEEFLRHADLVVVSSKMEQRTLLRDVPSCRSHVVFWGAGHARQVTAPPTDAFLRFANLTSGSYILQVGRLSARKNQLATLLATKDLDIPLVFIAMDRCNTFYEHMFLVAALQWRKAPVIIVSQHLSAELSQGALRILPTPEGKILSTSMLLSAFAHAGLHMHPAFYELPGYTYFESARFGIPTIASEWTSLKEYFPDAADDRIAYALPYDLARLKTLAEKKFGQKYPEFPLHPIYHRSTEEIARDFLRRPFLH